MSIVERVEHEPDWYEPYRISLATRANGLVFVKKSTKRLGVVRKPLALVEIIEEDETLSKTAKAASKKRPAAGTVPSTRKSDGETTAPRSRAATCRGPPVSRNVELR